MSRSIAYPCVPCLQAHYAIRDSSPPMPVAYQRVGQRDAGRSTPDRPSIKRYIEAWSRVTEKSRRAPLLCQQIAVVSASSCRRSNCCCIRSLGVPPTGQGEDDPRRRGGVKVSRIRCPIAGDAGGFPPLAIIASPLPAYTWAYTRNGSAEARTKIGVYPVPKERRSCLPPAP